MRKGRIFVVSAPSGSGKTTICKRVLKKLNNIVPSVSVTTRPRRTGEKNGRDYYYISEEAFKREIKKENFIEWEKNFGYFYGTPKKSVLKSLQKGRDLLFSIDVKGAMTIKKKFPESILIFVKPPSLRELSKRLKTRNTDCKEDIAKRLKIAKRELSFAPRYDYVVVNDKLNKAVNKVIAIIKKERRRGLNWDTSR